MALIVQFRLRFARVQFAAKERETMKLISVLFFVTVTLVLLQGITGSDFDDDEEVSMVLTECKRINPNNSLGRRDP